MKILVLGAGAVGGYFGARLLEAGSDVSFLVRERRAAHLARNGLVVRSPRGDVHLESPPTVQAGAVHGSWDLIILSCKAYDLDTAVEAIAPAVGPHTVILPLLNGMRHLEILDARFGAGRVLGGACLISAVLDEEGRIVHLNDRHRLIFGERGTPRSARVDAIAREFSRAAFESQPSPAIEQEMWEKWVFLASLAGATCLMRGTVADIVAAGGAPWTLALLEQCRAIAAHAGHAPRPQMLEEVRAMLSDPELPMRASMLGDVERGAPTEAEHVLGDLLARQSKGTANGPMLELAVTHLRTHEARRRREAGAGPRT
ncbi:MAG TPA: 2-dehydropantoate 2-reductase [Gammaproteobacteria bacterium]|nr:2-dehydropantoate 2-reductase [Gammaproteobacteria bacterium]